MGRVIADGQGLVRIVMGVPTFARDEESTDTLKPVPIQNEAGSC